MVGPVADPFLTALGLVLTDTGEPAVPGREEEEEGETTRGDWGTLGDCATFGDDGTDVRGDLGVFGDDGTLVVGELDALVVVFTAVLIWPTRGRFRALGGAGGVASETPVLSPETDRDEGPEEAVPEADPLADPLAAAAAAPPARRTSPALSFFLAMSLVCLFFFACSPLWTGWKRNALFTRACAARVRGRETPVTHVQARLVIRSG